MKNILLGFALGLYCYLSVIILKKVPAVESFEKSNDALLIRVIEMLALMVISIVTGKGGNVNLVGYAISLLIFAYLVHFIMNAQFYLNSAVKEAMEMDAERHSLCLPASSRFFWTGLTLNLGALALSIKSGFLRKKRNT